MFLEKQVYKFFAPIRLIAVPTLILLFAVATKTIAQNPVQDSLQKQFDAYQQKNLQEKIFIHTDKDFYLAGEIIWCKLYDVDAFYNKPVNLSKLAYVEVLDKNNKPVIQTKIGLKQGFGNGSIDLPVSLNSGLYKIRGYTNWMKNMGPDYFFEKTITLVNSRKPYFPDSTKKESFQIALFPEGGNLVNGLESKLAFKITDQYGRGVYGTGAIINSRNDTITRFTTLQMGIGNFLFTPKAGETYKAVVFQSSGIMAIQELPVAFDEGWVMRVDPANNNLVRISVQTNTRLSDPSLYLFAHTRNRTKLVRQASPQNGTAVFTVDLSRLEAGISHFTIFNSARKPVCERLLFKYPEQNLKPELVLNAKNFDTRSKVQVNVSSKTTDGKAMAANMSMAVYLIDSLQSITDLDITNYLLLSSDLPGTIESPGYYFEGGTEAEQAMDNLMLTQGWRRFDWENVLQRKSPAFEFVPEIGGHILTGKITDKKTGAPVKEIFGYLSVTGTQKKFVSALSNDSGLVKFDLGEMYSDGEVIAQVNFKRDSTSKIEILKPFSESYSSRTESPFALKAMVPATITAHNVSMQVVSAYTSDRQSLVKLPETDTSAFYFNADKTYPLDNYVRFTTMEEVLREYVAEVTVRKKADGFHLHSIDIQGGFIYDEEPLVLLDGVPVFDFNKFMAYDPLKIRKLDVIARGYYQSESLFQGIANFSTYQGNLDGYELDPSAAVIDYDGLQLQREFYSPSYELLPASRIPDFRNLLYWNPSVITNDQGKQESIFFTSDLPGKYAIVLQGITSDGKTGTQISYFEVNKKEFTQR